jgi:hypothetical protein
LILLLDWSLWFYELLFHAIHTNKTKTKWKTNDQPNKIYSIKHNLVRKHFAKILLYIFNIIKKKTSCSEHNSDRRVLLLLHVCLFIFIIIIILYDMVFIQQVLQLWLWYGVWTMVCWVYTHNVPRSKTTTKYNNIFFKQNVLEKLFHLMFGHRF